MLRLVYLVPLSGFKIRFSFFNGGLFSHRITCSCSGRSLRGNTTGSEVAQREQSSQVESYLFGYMQSGHDRGEPGAREKRNFFEARGVSSNQQGIFLVPLFAKSINLDCYFCISQKCLQVKCLVFYSM